VFWGDDIGQSNISAYSHAEHRPHRARRNDVHRPHYVSNEIVAHHDWLPTLLAVAGDTEVTQKLLKGYKLGSTTYKVHLDGYNLVPYLTGAAQKGPRESFIYVNDDQQMTALRYDNWKLVFMEQRVPGTLRIWAEPFVTLRVPKIFNLRTDPYERADITSNTYYDWSMDRAYLVVPSQAYVAEFPVELQGVSAATEGGELQPRGGHAQHERGGGSEVIADRWMVDGGERGTRTLDLGIMSATL
jgi:arylsulfatase A-like enzyme